MGWVVDVTLRPLYLQEQAGIRCTKGWVGPRAGLDGCRKSRPPPGFDPRTVQPVANPYTAYTISAHHCTVAYSQSPDSLRDYCSVKQSKDFRALLHSSETKEISFSSQID